MGEKVRQTRFISAHNLPMALSAPRAALGVSRNRPAAAFLTQLLATRPEGATQAPSSPDSRATAANSTYRAIETSDIKRMPMGYRKTMSA